jgi:hypothetical protein
MDSRHSLRSAAYLLVTVLLPFGQALRAETVEVGHRKELFVDDYVIDEKINVERHLGTVTKANRGEPIFTDGWFYGTVLHDQGRFKLWYRKFDGQGYGFAESQDGIHFTKTADVTGINFAGDVNLAVERNRDDPAARFIAGYDAPGMAAGIARSVDGVHWTPLNDGKPVTFRAADCHNQILWDPVAKVYRLFTRTDFGVGGGPLAFTVAEDFEVRGTRGMTNPDIFQDPANWKTVRQWHFNREGPKEYLRRQIYSMTVWQYEGVYFAVMAVYEYPADLREGLTTDHVKRHERDVMNFYIATSRDCDHWDLSWVYANRPIVPRGPDHSFDKDMVFPSSTIVTHDDRHWLYYGGSNERHGTAEREPPVWFESRRAIGLATLPLDRFVALRAAAPGTVVTKPFTLEGRTLQVNVDAPRGIFAVDVLNDAGKTIAGYEGEQYDAVDQLRLQPRWKRHGDLSPLVGRTVRLRFRLQNADLYAFQVK